MVTLELLPAAAWAAAMLLVCDTKRSAMRRPSRMAGEAGDLGVSKTYSAIWYGRSSESTDVEDSDRLRSISGGSSSGRGGWIDRRICSNT